MRYNHWATWHRFWALVLGSRWGRWRSSSWRATQGMVIDQSNICSVPKQFSFVDWIMKATGRCAICGCELHRSPGTYARPTVEGRSHASKHHFVAERFFGRSNNRRGTQRNRLFKECPWGVERKTEVFCYDCHEELLHNPIFLPIDIARLADLVKARHLNENIKTESKDKIAGRIKLLHEIIQRGIGALKE